MHFKNSQIRVFARQVVHVKLFTLLQYVVAVPCGMNARTEAEGEGYAAPYAVDGEDGDKAFRSKLLALDEIHVDVLHEPVPLERGESLDVRKALGNIGDGIAKGLATRILRHAEDQAYLIHPIA